MGEREPFDPSQTANVTVDQLRQKIGEFKDGNAEKIINKEEIEQTETDDYNKLITILRNTLHELQNITSDNFDINSVQNIKNTISEYIDDLKTKLSESSGKFLSRYYYYQLLSNKISPHYVNIDNIIDDFIKHGDIGDMGYIKFAIEDIELDLQNL